MLESRKDSRGEKKKKKQTKKIENENLFQTEYLCPLQIYVVILTFNAMVLGGETFMK